MSRIHVCRSQGQTSRPTQLQETKKVAARKSRFSIAHILLIILRFFVVVTNIVKCFGRAVLRLK